VAAGESKEELARIVLGANSQPSMRAHRTFWYLQAEGDGGGISVSHQP